MVTATTLRAGPEARPKPFSAAKLRAETEDPFGKVRIALFGFFTVSTAVSLLFTLPRLAATVAGVKTAAPLNTVLTDLGINGGSFALFAFLSWFELDVEQKKEAAKEEGALMARLKVWLQDGAGEEELVKLSDLRASRLQRARRPVICMGSKDFLTEVLDTAAERSEAVDRADLLIVPVLNSATAAADRPALAKAARDRIYVALPPEESGTEEAQNWDTLVQAQTAQVKSQGLDEASGQVIIMKKNGRVAARFLGVPNWDMIAGEINTRADTGLDTSNV